MRKIEKVFTATCFVLGVAGLILLFLGFVDFGVVLSSLVLIATALVIGKQAFATEKMVEYQSIPSIEMFLVCHKDGGHCFAFYNLSSIPGRVVFNLSFKQNDVTPELNYKNRDINYRIPPQGSLVTATAFFVNDDNFPKEIEIKKNFIVKIRAVILPDLDDVSTDTRRIYKKVYKFIDEHHDSLYNKRWNEETIGFPDILLFSPENAGLKKNVEIVVRGYMEKERQPKN